MNQHKPAQQTTLGGECTYKGKAFTGSQVAEALFAKMQQSHTANHQDSDFDQHFHDQIQAAIPTLLMQPSDPALDIAFSSVELKAVLTKLSGRPKKSPGPDGLR